MSELSKKIERKWKKEWKKEFPEDAKKLEESFQRDAELEECFGEDLEKLTEEFANEFFTKHYTSKHIVLESIINVHTSVELEDVAEEKDITELKKR